MVVSNEEEKDMNGALMSNVHNPSKSLEESLKEMKLMRQGKKPKKSWDDMVSEIKSNMDEGKY